MDATIYKPISLPLRDGLLALLAKDNYDELTNYEKLLEAAAILDHMDKTLPRTRSTAREGIAQLMGHFNDELGKTENVARPDDQIRVIGYGDLEKVVADFNMEVGAKTGQRSGASNAPITVGTTTSQMATPPPATGITPQWGTPAPQPVRKAGLTEEQEKKLAQLIEKRDELAEQANELDELITKYDKVIDRLEELKHSNTTRTVRRSGGNGLWGRTKRFLSDTQPADKRPRI